MHNKKLYLKTKKTLIFSLFFFISNISFSQELETIYKQVGPDGEVIYSHQPSPGAQRVHIQNYKSTPVAPIHSFDSDTQLTSSSTQPQENQNPNPSPTRYQITFDLPKNEQIYPMGNPTVIIKLNINPGLYPNDKIQLFIDEKPYGPLQSDLHYTLTDLDRGQHALQAKIYANAKPPEDSDALTPKGETGVIVIHVQRASIYSPAH